ncbi:MAG: hypothetical protein NWQ44_00225 [Flavobacteriales bacterium]|jgi:hypothetical protein|nr:hypothetical protein [Flavobacteriales bacterium]MDP4716388.1 hypothetical protein [Flavobacteriales bacterium]MDP4731166.1 hypothetical protein [Flavobacteriales bacterium]MDP4818024.1 hypothetical protein [Flavobacteriales bacterium]MDP4950132.1 hypothetical protein [Flavobacteriales bacterium]
MKKIILCLALVSGLFTANAQRVDRGMTMFSPGYTFSLIDATVGDSSVSSFAQNFNLSVLRFESSFDRFAFDGGVNLQYLSIRSTGSGEDVNVRFAGFSPEVRGRYYFFPNEDKNNRGPFIGAGMQFILPLAKSSDVSVTSIRPTFQMGISRKKNFNVVVAPNFVNIAGADLDSWFFGFDVDLFKF